MDKTVKNVLAAVGAVAVATTAPVLTLGVAIGAVAANPEKAKKTAQDLVDKVTGGLENFAAEQEAKYGAYDRASWDDADGEETEPDTPADDSEGKVLSKKERLMQTLEALIDEIDEAF